MKSEKTHQQHTQYEARAVNIRHILTHTQAHYRAPMKHIISICAVPAEKRLVSFHFIVRSTPIALSLSCGRSLYIFKYFKHSHVFSEELAYTRSVRKSCFCYSRCCCHCCCCCRYYCCCRFCCCVCLCVFLLISTLSVSSTLLRI